MVKIMKEVQKSGVTFVKHWFRLSEISPTYLFTLLPSQSLFLSSVTLPIHLLSTNPMVPPPSCIPPHTPDTLHILIPVSSKTDQKNSSRAGSQPLLRTHFRVPNTAETWQMPINLLKAPFTCPVTWKMLTYIIWGHVYSTTLASKKPIPKTHTSGKFRSLDKNTSRTRLNPISHEQQRTE